MLVPVHPSGIGINLGTADTVVIFNSDCNPQNDLQVECITHRMEQKRNVKLFCFLMADSLEEDILERAKRKRFLEHVVIHGVVGGHNYEGKDHEMTFKNEELSAFLSFGAVKLFVKDRLGQDNNSISKGAVANNTVKSEAVPIGDGIKSENKEDEDTEGDAPIGDKTSRPDEIRGKSEHKRKCIPLYLETERETRDGTRNRPPSRCHLW